MMRRLDEEASSSMCEDGEKRGTWKHLEKCERRKRTGYGMEGRKGNEKTLRGSKLQENVERPLLKQSMKFVLALWASFYCPGKSRCSKDLVLEIHCGSWWPGTSHSVKRRPFTPLHCFSLPTPCSLSSLLGSLPLSPPRPGYPSRTDFHFPQVHTVHTD